MIARWLALPLLAAFAAAAPASAQRTSDPNCSDDRGVDRCAPEQQRRIRQLFGVASIEEHRAAGDEVRRVFYVDGYGREVVLIAFVRAPGRDPTVWIHFPQREGEARPVPLQAAVPQTIWNQVVELSMHFHRSFVEPGPEPEANSEEGEIAVCLHSWVYTIEAVDRAWLGSQPQIRRKTEDSCQDGPGEAYAQQLDRLARSLFPHCAALDEKQYRNEATALSACRILRGDRLAGAEVLNRADAFTDVQGPEDASLISGLFDDDVTIDWGGEQHRGDGFDADEFWAARVRHQNGRTVFFIHDVEGMNAGRVRLTGSFLRPAAAVTGQPDRYEAAAVEQIWTRVNGGDWVVEQATVGPWRRESSD